MTSPTENVPAVTDRNLTEPGLTEPGLTEQVPGRTIVLEPMPRGLWQIILGAIAAVLGPLFGFLVGSMMGPGDPQAEVNSMFLALFVGIVIGGIGMVVALLGGLRLLRRQAQAAADAEETAPPA